MTTPEEKRAELRRSALEYHEFPTPGKIAIAPTKSLVNQRDLALAYSPGVAAACEEIVADPANAFRYTSRGNLVAVVTNGTAVLGLGDIGPLASKPVMEGKAVLFKKFAGIDVFDIEVAEKNLDKLVDIIAALEPTFGGINLEDIKAPDCFYVERKLRERMKIPVFHDDQHGTAGVVYQGRAELMDPDKAEFAQVTEQRKLSEVIGEADIFLGLSAGGVLKADMVARMADNPIIFALANPTPEILPEEVKAVRDDAIMATGRSDFPNQVNNVLCFPYIFRGALDSGATTITDEMEIAAVYAIAELAQAEQSDVVAAAYVGATLSFGPEYLIPKPFDPRLMIKIAPAVAKAAADSGVAIRPITDYSAYTEKLQSFVYASGHTMKPIFSVAKRAKNKRIAYAEGENEGVLRAAQIVVDENLARPTLVGRKEVIEQRIERFGLRLKSGIDYDIVSTENDPRYRDYWQTYHRLADRKGVTEQMAKIEMRRRLTLIGSMLLHKGEVDGLICGTWGSTALHLHYIDQVIGKRPGVKTYAAMTGLILPGRTVNILDTHINYDPTAEQLAEITIMAAEEMLRFGPRPKAALLSHSNFGSSNEPSAVKMRDALRLIQEQAPWLEIDGEMHGDTALDAEYRKELMPRSTLTGEANLLVCPNIDAANISYNLLKTAAGGGIAIGPVLLGAAKPVHILTPSATVRRIVNMTALTVADANAGR